YILIIFEEKIHLAKSKPIIVASSLMWVFAAILANQQNKLDILHDHLEHSLLEYGELLLFLLVAMTYVNVMRDRNIFESLRSWLVTKQFSLRKIFFLTGIMAFFISPLA